MLDRSAADCAVESEPRAHTDTALHALIHVCVDANMIKYAVAVATKQILHPLTKVRDVELRPLHSIHTHLHQYA